VLPAVFCCLRRVVPATLRHRWAVRVGTRIVTGGSPGAGSRQIRHVVEKRGIRHPDRRISCSLAPRDVPKPLNERRSR